MNERHTAKRVDDGYEYRGRFIYRASTHGNAYNPWRVMGSRHGFATLKDAKAHVDAAESSKAAVPA